MRRRLVALASASLLAALAGCHEDVEMFPIGPGGFGTGGGTTPDAAIGGDGGDGGSTISGRVCLISDARNPTTCASSGAEDLTVTLGSATATTAADGSFTIASATGTGLVWRVTGAAIQASAMQVSTVATIPVISALLYEDMVTTNNVVGSAGTGAIIARFTTNDSGVSGLIAATSPDPEGQIFYDGTSATVWDVTATSTFGAIWVPGLAAGATTLTVGGAADSSITGIPVYADTITFVLAEIP
jgi:hypothetical protein